MNFLEIIKIFYPDDTPLRRLLLHHSRQVAEKALEAVRRHPELHLDARFVEAGAMLHDIGIIRCDAPGIHCYGTQHYLLHGIEGARMLQPIDAQLARVCARHTGTGLTPEVFLRRGLPVPEVLAQDFSALTPETEAEQLICYADKFFSKSHPERTRTVEETAASLRKFGDDGVKKFYFWADRYE